MSLRDDGLILYVYQCKCGYKGEIHLVGDHHDGEKRKCNSCGNEVELEWDGGVILDLTHTNKDDKNL